MSEHRKALIGLFGVAVLWGFSYVISAYLLDFFSPILLSFTRMIVTWLSLLTLLLSQGRPRWPSKKEWLLLMASSVFGTLIQQPFYFIGLHLSTAANASLLYAAAPLVAVLLEKAFLGTRLSGAKLIGGSLGIFGVIIIISFSGTVFRVSLGDLILMLGMLGMTIGMLFTPALARTLSALEINILSGPVGILLMAPVAGGEALLGHTFFRVSAVILLLLLLLGAITALSGLLWTRGIAVTGPGTAAMFMNIPPFISLIAGHFLLKEPIHGIQVVGGILVLIACTSRTAKPQWRQKAGV